MRAAELSSARPCWDSWMCLFQLFGLWMQASVKINDLSCMTEGNYSHSQTCTWCSRSEHFPEHHTLTPLQDSSEVQSHVKFMFRWSEGDEVKPCARTLKKNKPQHLLIRPKPEQVWYFSFRWTWIFYWLPRDLHWLLPSRVLFPALWSFFVSVCPRSRLAPQ